MCIAAWIWQAHPVYDLLLLFNRDEMHERPAEPVAWWADGDQKLLGPRDGRAGGTWIGCTRDGRVAFLTNVMLPDRRPDAKSRGDLPRRFLERRTSPLDFAEEIVKEADQYNGFNLLLADICAKVMVYISNRPKGKPISVQVVSPGLYVLSNGTLDTPWPKTERLRRSFEELLRNHGEEEVVVEELIEKLMGDTVQADRECVQYTGYDPEWELKMSSIFVDVETEKGRYGTRSRVALSVKRTGYVTFYERNLEGGMWKDHTVEYHIEKVQQMESLTMYTRHWLKTKE